VQRREDGRSGIEAEPEKRSHSSIRTFSDPQRRCYEVGVQERGRNLEEGEGDSARSWEGGRATDLHLHLVWKRGEIDGAAERSSGGGEGVGETVKGGGAGRRRESERGTEGSFILKGGKVPERVQLGEMEYKGDGFGLLRDKERGGKGRGSGDREGRSRSSTSLRWLLANVYMLECELPFDFFQNGKL